MKTSEPIIRAEIRLANAVEELICVRRGKDHMRQQHFIDAREAICGALMPDQKVPYGKAEEWLVDLIATAITDSTDLDCTSESQARHIVDELFKHLRPEASE